MARQPTTEKYRMARKPKSQRRKIQKKIQGRDRHMKNEAEERRERRNLGRCHIIHFFVSIQKGPLQHSE